MRQNWSNNKVACVMLCLVVLMQTTTDIPNKSKDGHKAFEQTKLFFLKTIQTFQHLPISLKNRRSALYRLAPCLTQKLLLFYN